jgi:RHS repeat-associated protein
VVWEDEAVPFGESAGASGLIASRLKFTGKDLDAATGLYYFNARWYDSGTGRFTSEDPIRDGGNWYRYAAGNPLTRIDPTGLEEAPFQGSLGPFDIALKISEVETGDEWYNDIVDTVGAGVAGVYNLTASVLNWGLNVLGAAGAGVAWVDEKAYEHLGFGLEEVSMAAYQVEMAAGGPGAIGQSLRRLRMWGRANLGVLRGKVLARMGRGAAAGSGGLLDSASFAQKTYNPMFSARGKFAGRSVDDVAAALRSGALNPGDVPIDYIVRNGNTLMLNTRSAQALEAAGIPRSAWNAVNRTGQDFYENLLTGQLQRNNLTSAGIDAVRRSGGQ